MEVQTDLVTRNLLLVERRVQEANRDKEVIMKMIELIFITFTAIHTI
jgi:hypothetical protein